jgi:hypothetical protein
LQAQEKYAGVDPWNHIILSHFVTPDLTKELPPADSLRLRTCHRVPHGRAVRASPVSPEEEEDRRRPPHFPRAVQLVVGRPVVTEVDCGLGVAGMRGVAVFDPFFRGRFSSVARSRERCARASCDVHDVSVRTTDPDLIVKIQLQRCRG